jgi:hypothetical protein
LPAQLGQKPLFLQLNATIFSSLQQLHLRRRKPYAGIPHLRNAHSLSANDTLGGPEKRTGHKLVTGGNIGLQVAF